MLKFLPWQEQPEWTPWGVFDYPNWVVVHPWPPILRSRGYLADLPPTLVKEETITLARNEWRWGKYVALVYYANDDPRGEQWLTNLWWLSRIVDLLPILKHHTRRSLRDGYYYQR